MFQIKSKLTKHMRQTHEKRKKFKCQICLQYFNSFKDRSQHIAADHQETQVTQAKANYTCSVCTKKFAQLRFLQMHVEKAHPSLFEESDAD